MQPSAETSRLLLWRLGIGLEAPTQQLHQALIELLEAVALLDREFAAIYAGQRSLDDAAPGEETIFYIAERTELMLELCGIREVLCRRLGDQETLIPVPRAVVLN